jgi:hypothetical protein
MCLPQFTIRDLMWLMLLAATCCGWWVYVQKVEHRHRQQVEEILNKHEQEAAANRFRLYGS